MRPRVWFFFVTAFFVTMNVLLWRSEFSGRSTLGSAVRPRVVFERLLETSDRSDLEIRHRQQRIGRCRWTPSLVEEVNRDDAQAAAPEGMVRRLTGYTVDLKGDILPRNSPPIHFDAQLRLSTNLVWTAFEVTLKIQEPGKRPRSELTVRANAERNVITLRPPLFTGGDNQTEEVLSLDELRDPSKLLERLGGAALPGALAALGLPGLGPSSMSGAFDVKWEAFKGQRVQLGGLPAKVYALRTRLLGQYPLTLLVTETGEIFRIELPDELLLVNEKLLVL